MACTPITEVGGCGTISPHYIQLPGEFGVKARKAMSAKVAFSVLLHANPRAHTFGREILNYIGFWGADAVAFPCGIA